MGGEFGRGVGIWQLLLLTPGWVFWLILLSQRRGYLNLLSPYVGPFDSSFNREAAFFHVKLLLYLLFVVFAENKHWILLSTPVSFKIRPCIILYLQDINQINTHADEMDLFTMVTRRFKKVFSKQEQMRTFPIYDASIEVSLEIKTSGQLDNTLTTETW